MITVPDRNTEKLCPYLSPFGSPNGSELVGLLVGTTKDKASKLSGANSLETMADPNPRSVCPLQDYLNL